MDPLSALIGGGMSLAGGLLSSTNAQAINQQNIANQQAMASGAYLPQLISNANRAGINPLAALGIHTPSAGMAVPTDPGGGLKSAGAAMAQVNPVQRELEQLAVEKGRSDVRLLESQVNNENIRAATALHALEQLRRDPKLMGPGVQEPASRTATPIPQIDWFRQLGGVDVPTFYDLTTPKSPPVTSGPSNLRRYWDNFWSNK